MRPAIIDSLLATDLYKYSMSNVIFSKFNDYTTTWTFKCRNEGVMFTPAMVDAIREELLHYCGLRFKPEDLQWLRQACPWLSQGYLDYLRYWYPDQDEIIVNGEAVSGKKVDIRPYNDCGLAIETRGTWLSTSMYEIAILAIVNEVYFSHAYDKGQLTEAFMKRTMDKVGKLSETPDGDKPYFIGAFSEFGMRRRLSAYSQDWLIGYLKANAPGFVGTSNVYLAKKHGVKPVGTMAHEYIQCVGQGDHALNPAYSNRFAMHAWVDTYQTRNGIALTDTISMDVFLRDFDLTYATLFSGVRHDSGDPIAWGEKLLAHYEKLGIDPKGKTLLFSDSLDFKRATDIKRHFDGRCKVAFGIGTYLANDTGVEPLNIVMKVTECNGAPVAKLSDCPGKGMCRDDAYVEYLKRAIDWRLTH